MLNRFVSEMIFSFSMKDNFFSLIQIWIKWHIDAHLDLLLNLSLIRKL